VAVRAEFLAGGVVTWALRISVLSKTDWYVDQDPFCALPASHPQFLNILVQPNIFVVVLIELDSDPPS
jgi:hypothetical protein